LNEEAKRDQRNSTNLFMNELGPQTKKYGTNVKDENDFLYGIVWGIFWFLDVGMSVIRNQCIIMEYIEWNS